MAHWTILGEGLDGGTNERHFGITLDTKSKTWTASGPSVAMFFNTRSGSFALSVVPEIGSQLLDDSDREVAFFTGLFGSSLPGAHGRGRASEMGANFSWVLDSH